MWPRRWIEISVHVIDECVNRTKNSLFTNWLRSCTTWLSTNTIYPTLQMGQFGWTTSGEKYVLIELSLYLYIVVFLCQSVYIGSMLTADLLLKYRLCQKTFVSVLIWLIRVHTQVNTFSSIMVTKKYCWCKLAIYLWAWWATCNPPHQKKSISSSTWIHGLRISMKIKPFHPYKCIKTVL